MSTLTKRFIAFTPDETKLNGTVFISVKETGDKVPHCFFEKEPDKIIQKYYIEDPEQKDLVADWIQKNKQNLKRLFLIAKKELNQKTPQTITKIVDEPRTKNKAFSNKEKNQKQHKEVYEELNRLFSM